jgi:hypothetical protein
MAIGPEQIEDNFKEEVDEFETIIDRNLSKATFSKGNNTVSVSAPRGMRESHFKALKERYLSAGWTSVRREYGHQREPLDDIIFEK